MLTAVSRNANDYFSVKIGAVCKLDRSAKSRTR